MKIKISKKDKKNIEKEIARQIKENGKIVDILKKNKGKIKKAGFKIKATTWIDPETKEKKLGGTIELIETESNSKILDGINIDLGVTDNLDVLFGISKDFKITGEKEFSIGGYIDIIDTSKKFYKRFIKKDKNTKMNIKVKIGLSKVF